MRLFTGLSIPPAALQTIEPIVAALRPAAPLRWSPAANLHVTSAFIGHWPEDRLQELREALNQMPSPGPVRVTVTGFGFFPNPHHPHSFFLAVERDPALCALAESLEGLLRGLGMPREDRTYTPHITLARIGHENITELRHSIASMNTPFPLPAFTAEEFHLYESRPGAGTSIYTAIANFPLEQGARA